MARAKTLRAAAVAVLAAATTVLAAPITAAHAATCASERIEETAVPWAQRALASQRVWPFSTGTGITVAVLDSGVDADHRQLRGRVEPGYDAVAGGGPANTDCRGTGTQVAGVIAAARRRDVGLAGLAPGARILPIQVVHDEAQEAGVAEPEVLARGIEVAIDRGADVIAVAAVTYEHSQRLAVAVSEAIGRGITVVAAVGDLRDGTDNRVPYPAAYSGVIGVGAIDQAGARWSGSRRSRHVDLMAPGADVLSLQTGSGLVRVSGTAVACGFVAATAALVRASRGSTRDVPAVLFGTATPGPDGFGVVNPYAAVNNQLVDAEPVPPPALPRAAGPDADDGTARLALAGAGAALLATVAVIVIAIAVPRGRRRFWRGTLAPRPVTPDEPEEPGPPIELFGDMTMANDR